jgi:hypothetical protein
MKRNARHPIYAEESKWAMESPDSQNFFLSRVTAATIRVVLLGGWVAWCLQIVLPFLVPIFSRSATT